MSTRPASGRCSRCSPSLALALGVRRLRRRRRARRPSADTSRPSCGNLIEANPDNGRISLTIGSKNFTEQFILGEIYAQALEAAGYDVSTDLNLGSEQVALKALENGEISGYPEYTSTALTSFFDIAPEDVPGGRPAGVRAGAGRLREGGPGRLPADAVLERERGRAC